MSAQLESSGIGESVSQLLASSSGSLVNDNIEIDLEEQKILKYMNSSKDERQTYLKNGGEHGFDTKVIVIPHKSAPGKMYRVHRFFFKVASKQFDKIFSKTENEVKFINKFTPRQFEKIMTYVYFDQIDAKGRTKKLELLGIAVKYEINGLIEALLEQIKSGCGYSSIMKVYSYACKEDLEIATWAELKAWAVSQICRFGETFFRQESHINLSEKKLIELIKRDDFCISSELKLFEGVIRWGKSQCIKKGLNPDVGGNLRRTLSHIIRFVRFPLMLPAEFVENTAFASPNRSRVLKEEDLISLLSYFILTTSDKRMKMKQGQIFPAGYNSTPRVAYDLHARVRNSELLTRKTVKRAPITHCSDSDSSDCSNDENQKYF